MVADKSGQASIAKQFGSPYDEEQRRTIAELLAIDQKSRECHGCGAKTNLRSWQFGLGKPMSAGALGDTAVSVALSAVGIPLVGVGALQLSGKKGSYRVLRLSLVLCDACWRKRISYSAHPWWQAAGRLGYTDFFEAADIKRLQLAN